MIRNIFRRRRNGALLCAMALMTLLPQQIYANLEGKWVVHPANSMRTGNREAQVYKIIDGNRYVYFAVRGGNFQQTGINYDVNYFETDNLQLFRYDKSKEWNNENIVPLVHEVDASGVIPYLTEYSPEFGAMVVVYDSDYTMDIIFDDGRLLKSGVLKDVILPGTPGKPYSISFDVERNSCYVATNYGYVEISMRNGELLNSVRLDKKVAFVSRLGQNMILFAGDNVARDSYSTTTYIFPASNPPASLAGYELTLENAITDVPMGAGNSLQNLQGLMPLTENSFAAIAPYTTDNNYNLILVTLSEDGNQGELLGARETLDASASVANRHLFRTDGYWNATEDGYMISGQNNLYFLKKGIDVDYASPSPLDSYKSKALKVLPKNALTAYEKAAKVSSFDGEKVWSYAYDPLNANTVADRGFYSRNITEGSLAKEVSTLCAPNAPTMSIAHTIEWNPKYGMIFRGTGSSYRNTYGGNDLLCSYKDGEWTDRSYYAWYAPNQNLSLGMRNFTSDPLYPDHIWGVYLGEGLLRTDLSDYSNSILYGRNNSGNRNLQGYFAVFDPQPGWASFNNFSSVAFDANGTMWVVRDFFIPQSPYNYQKNYADAFVDFSYLTKEDREKIAVSSNFTAETILKPRPIRVWGKAYSTTEKLMSMKYPGNENFLVLNGGGQTRIPFNSTMIFDHNGTLENTEDDRQVMLLGMTEEDGMVANYICEYALYEDPLTGYLWIGSNNGVYMIDPHKALDGSKEFKRLEIKGNAGTDFDFLRFDGVPVSAIAHDVQGRKWLATLTNGVYCISPDASTLLAHYTVSNSELPSNDVVALACDMANGTVFCGTLKGIAEFQPEETVVHESSIASISILPSQIHPDYNGYVSIYGVMDNEYYQVVDDKGNVKADLGRPESSKIQWDLKDTGDQRITSGKYYLSRKGKEDKIPVIVL